MVVSAENHPSGSDYYGRLSGPASGLGDAKAPILGLSGFVEASDLPAQDDDHRAAGAPYSPGSVAAGAGV